MSSPLAGGPFKPAVGLSGVVGRGIVLGLAFLPILGSVRLRSLVRTRIRRGLLRLLLLVIALWGMWGCSGGSGYFNRSPQTYPLQLTATNGTVTHSATLTLTVQ